jgi:hypothetical protein
VCDDSCIRVDHSSYAAGPARIGTKVLMRLFDHHLEIRDMDTKVLLRTHARAQRPGSLTLPEEERIFNPSRQTKALFRQAQEIGPAAHALCEQLFSQQGRVGQRQLWGIVGLVKHYPHRLINQACQQALDSGICSYRHIKATTHALLTNLIATVDREDAFAPTNRLIQTHPLIRPMEVYADLFTHAASSGDDTGRITTTHNP